MPGSKAKLPGHTASVGDKVTNHVAASVLAQRSRGTRESPRTIQAVHSGRLLLAASSRRGRHLLRLAQWSVQAELGDGPISVLAVHELVDVDRALQVAALDVPAHVIDNALLVDLPVRIDRGKAVAPQQLRVDCGLQP